MDYSNEYIRIRSQVDILNIYFEYILNSIHAKFNIRDTLQRLITMTLFLHRH